MTSLIEPRSLVIGAQEWRAFGLRFPNENFARIVYQRAQQAGLARNQGDISVLKSEFRWRAKPTEHVVLVLDASKDGWYVEGVDWFPGEPFELPENVFIQMIGRRAKMGDDGVQRMIRHYEGGMRINDDFTLRPADE